MSYQRRGPIKALGVAKAWGDGRKLLMKNGIDQGKREERGNATDPSKNVGFVDQTPSSSAEDR